MRCYVVPIRTRDLLISGHLATKRIFANCSVFQFVIIIIVTKLFSDSICLEVRVEGTNSLLLF